MANKAASIVRYANLPGIGWRRGNLVKARNGRYRPGFMKYDGKEFEATQGVYQIRTYSGKKAVYVAVGNDLDDATAIFERMTATRQMETAQVALGIATAPKPEEGRKTMAEQAAAYIAKKLSPSMGLSRTSTRMYERTLNAFTTRVKRVYTSDVTEEDVTAFCDWLVEQGYSQKSRAMRYTIVRGFLQSCGVDLKRLMEASTHKRLSSKPEGDTEPYTRQEIEKLLAVCTPYYKMVFTLLLQTGMRFKEASHLTWANVKWDENKIFVPGEQRITNRGKVKEFQSKNRKGRRIPMFPTLKAALTEWRKQNPNTVYVVGSERGDQPNNHWIAYGKKLWKKAGLNCGVCDSCAAKGECEKFYLHKFRHTYAHRCLDRNPDIYELSRNMGHHDISVTIIYLKGRTSNIANDPFADAA